MENAKQTYMYAATLAQFHEKPDQSGANGDISIRRFAPAIREGFAKIWYQVGVVKFCAGDAGGRFPIGGWNRVSYTFS